MGGGGDWVCIQAIVFLSFGLRETKTKMIKRSGDSLSGGWGRWVCIQAIVFLSFGPRETKTKM